MALKFLNKKGWHTGSLRNIENVWKAEQKRDAEDKKLEELRKQILEERERSEFRLLQEQAGLVPKQERLDFLYDSGLAVGKGNSEGFKALEDLPKTQTDASTSSSKTSAPGALLEDKPQSANDAWRKLHTDPLLLIKQREQEALARVQNNPIQMAMIRKSVEANKDKGQKHSKSGHKKKHKEERSMHERSYGKGQIGSEKATSDRDGRVKSNHDKYSRGEKRSSEVSSDLEHDAEKRLERRKSSPDKGNHDKYSRGEKRSSEIWSDSEHAEKRVERRKSGHDKSNHDKYSRGEKRSSEVWSDLEHDAEERVERRKSSHDKKLKDEVHSSRGLSSLEAPTKTEENRGVSSSKNRPKLKHEKLSPEEPSGLRDASRERRSHQADGDHKNADSTSKQKTNSTEVGAPTESYGRRSSGKHSNTAPKLSAEERAARLREMEMDAELHEQQRWKRLKKASEDDAREVKQVDYSGGQSFLDDARKSVYGADKGGSSTIEESVRRRSYYLQRRSEAGEQNAYRR